MDDALKDMSDRVGSKNLEFVMTAVTIQRQVGGSLAGLFDMVADTVRNRQQFARKVRSLTAMGRMSAYVLVGLPFFMAAALTLLNSSYMAPLYHTPMGHALIALSLPGVDPVHKVSIIPRGVGALGYTIQRPIEDRFLMTKEELENKMAVLLGGRAAELIVFNHLSTGAADDLRRVTDISRSMVTRYGMSEKLGSVAYERDPGNFLAGADRPYPVREREYADETAAAVDEEVRAIVDRVFERAQGILKARRAILDRAAKKLLQKETLEQSDLEALIRETPKEALRAV